MKELKFNLKYLINKKEFYFAIFITFFVNLVHVFLSIKDSLRLNQFFEELYTGEYQFILYNTNVNLQALVFVVFPIVCSMILADSNFLENKNKTTNMINNRIRRNNNIWIRLILNIVLTFFICFLSFMFNYIILRIIFGSGNYATFTQDVAFHIDYMPEFFLDSLRINNPTLFVIVINLSVSFIYGLLSGLSYSFSFFVKNKIIIYFIPLIFLISSELFFHILGLEKFSFFSALQPFSKFNMVSYIICVGILLICTISLIILKIRKRDELI